MKAAVGGESPHGTMPQQSYSPKVQKNYILCHVRRVQGKADSDDEGGPTQTNLSKIPNKINKHNTDLAPLQGGDSKIDLRLK